MNWVTRVCDNNDSNNNTEDYSSGVIEVKQRKGTV